MTWNIDRSRVMVWAIDHDDRSKDFEIGSFASHADAAVAALKAALKHKLLLVDHTAVDADGIWSLRPVAAAIHVRCQANGFSITVEPSPRCWSAPAGWFASLDVAGDRAVCLCERLMLPVVDHVFTSDPAA